MSDRMTPKITWHGDPRPDLEAAILQELSDWGLDFDTQPTTDLLTHTHILTGDFKGPTVHVWGEEDGLHMQYSETTEWVTLDTAMDQQAGGDHE